MTGGRRLGRGGDAGAGGSDHAGGGTPGKRTATQRLAVQRKTDAGHGGGDDARYAALYDRLAPAQKKYLDDLLAKNPIDHISETTWRALAQQLGTTPDDCKRAAAWLVRRHAPKPTGSTTKKAIDPRLEAYKGGYSYKGHDANVHLDSLGKLPAPLVDLVLPTAKEKQIELYRYVCHTEGGASAINTYDDQLVTVGPGFSARSGRAGNIFLRMPPEFLRELHDLGVDVKPDGSLAVTDEHGARLEGDEALLSLSQDPAKLSGIIRLCESAEQMGEWSARDWMLRAQFTDFVASIERYWSTLQGWPMPVLKLAYKMHHWQPTPAPWSRMIDWYGGGADHLFSEVRKAIVAYHGDAGDYTDAKVKARMEESAAKAGVTIAWEQ